VDTVLHSVACVRSWKAPYKCFPFVDTSQHKYRSVFVSY